MPDLSFVLEESISVFGGVDESQPSACAIANCVKAANSICLYDPIGKKVELHDYEVIEQKGIPAAIYLCGHHCESFFPPKGWSIEDLRSPQQILGTEVPRLKEFNTPLLHRAFKNTRQLD